MISSLDNEFTNYWRQLNSSEKKSLLNIARNYVQIKETEAPFNIEQYNKEIEDAMKRIDAGEYLTHEQVTELSKHWLNGK